MLRPGSVRLEENGKRTGMRKKIQGLYLRVVFRTLGEKVCLALLLDIPVVLEIDPVLRFCSPRYTGSHLV